VDGTCVNVVICVMMLECLWIEAQVRERIASWRKAKIVVAMRSFDLKRERPEMRAMGWGGEELCKTVNTRTMSRCVLKRAYRRMRET